MPRRRSGGATRPTRPLLQTRVRRFEGVFDAVGTPAFPKGKQCCEHPIVGNPWPAGARTDDKRTARRRRSERSPVKLSLGSLVPNAIAFRRAGCTVIYQLSCTKYSCVVHPRVILSLCVGVACDGNAPAQQYAIIDISPSTAGTRPQFATFGAGFVPFSVKCHKIR